MTAQADSAAPTGGGELNWLWRVALVGGLTLVVVLVWALRESGADPAPTLESAPVEAVGPAAAAPAPQAAAESAPSTVAPALSSSAAPTALDPPGQSGIIPGRPDPPAPLRPAAFERYLVQRGETLFLIGALRGVAVEDLLLFNPELGDGSMLAAGAMIWIPIWEAEGDDAP